MAFAQKPLSYLRHELPKLCRLLALGAPVFQKEYRITAPVTVAFQDTHQI